MQETVRCVRWHLKPSCLLFVQWQWLRGKNLNGTDCCSLTRAQGRQQRVEAGTDRPLRCGRSAKSIAEISLRWCCVVVFPVVNLLLFAGLVCLVPLLLMATNGHSRNPGWLAHRIISSQQPSFKIAKCLYSLVVPCSGITSTSNKTYPGCIQGCIP